MLHNSLNPEPTSTGIRSGNRVIGYSAAIRLQHIEKHIGNLSSHHIKKPTLIGARAFCKSLQSGGSHLYVI